MVDNFTGVRYAVFGLGNSQCFKDRFNVVGPYVFIASVYDVWICDNKALIDTGQQLDKRLELLGASRVINTGISA